MTQRGRWTGPSAALAIYLLTALVTQFHALEHFSSGCACSGTDPTGFVWAMAWWPHALLHLPHNPFITQAIWTPGGLNLAANTAVPTLGLLGMPVTAIAGPMATYNVWSILAPVTGALCAYRLCLALTNRQPAAILGGWLYGFSTYETTHLMGHLNLVFTFAAPALALLILHRMRQRISRRRFIGLAACVLIAQIGISTEMLATLTGAGVIALLAGVIFAPNDRRRSLVALLPEVGGAYLVAGVVTSLFLFYAVKGPAAIVAANAPNVGADLLSFVVPPVTAWLGGGSWAHVTTHFLTGPAENSAYLGLPLIAIFLLAALRSRRDWRTRALVASTVAYVLWSLGSHLLVTGGQHVELPWGLVSGHSYVREIIPARIAVYTALGVAVAAALWLTAAPARAPRLLRWLLAAAAVVFLFPNPSAAEYSVTYPIPSFFVDGTYRHYLTPDEVVLPFPFGLNGNALLWQSSTHFAFRLASGIFTTPSPYLSQPATHAFLSLAPATPQADGPLLTAFLEHQHVGAVVIQDGTAPGWDAVLGSLGYRGTDTGGVDIFRVAVTP